MVNVVDRRINLWVGVDASTLAYAEELRKGAISFASDSSRVAVTRIELPKNSFGSTGHALVCDFAVKNFESGAINVVCDSDAFLALKGWDDYLYEEILERKTGCFGVCYEKIGGFSSGDNRVQTYKSKLNAVWVAFSPAFDWSTLSFLPAKEKNLKIDTEELSEVFGLPLGYELLRDVGWQLPLVARELGAECRGMEKISPLSPDAVALRENVGALVSFTSAYSEEFHCSPGVPYVLHQRGSARQEFRKSKISREFFAAYDAWMEKQLAR